MSKLLDDFQKIRVSKKLVSIEWVFGLIIFWLKQFTLTEIILNRGRWPLRRRYQFVDWYVLITTILLAGMLWLNYAPLRWLAFDILAGSIINMANVVFLTKVFGEPISNGRTLLLFVFNVFQVILTFAIWYRFAGPQCWDAIFNAVMVFGTLDYPKKTTFEDIVAVQIATDFFLLAIYLAFVVGDLRRR